MKKTIAGMLLAGSLLISAGPVGASDTITKQSFKIRAACSVEGCTYMEVLREGRQLTVQMQGQRYKPYTAVWRLLVIYTMSGQTLFSNSSGVYANSVGKTPWMIVWRDCGTDYVKVRAWTWKQGSNLTPMVEAVA